jgi:hypothetical protein
MRKHDAHAEECEIAVLVECCSEKVRADRFYEQREEESRDGNSAIERLEATIKIR